MDVRRQAPRCREMVRQASLKTLEDGLPNEIPMKFDNAPEYVPAPVRNLRRWSSGRMAAMHFCIQIAVTFVHVCSAVHRLPLAGDAADRCP